MKQNNHKLFFSLQEIAERWGCNVKTIRRIVEKGELKTHRLGCQIRVHIDDLETYEKLRRS